MAQQQHGKHQQPARRNTSGQGAARSRGSRSKAGGAPRNSRSASRNATQKSANPARSRATHAAAHHQSARNSRANGNAGRVRPSGKRASANQGKRQNYNSVPLWSSQQYKGPASSKAQGSARPNRSGDSIPAKILAAVSAIFAAIGKGLAAIGSAWLRLVKSNKVAGIVSAAVVVILVLCLFDSATTSGRAYSGVKIGTVDVSGMNEQQMAEALQTSYVEPFQASTVTIYASEEAASKTSEAREQQNAQDAVLAEQMAVEEAMASKEAWQGSAESLGAAVDVQGAIKQALAVGREDGGFFARIGAKLFGRTITPAASLDSERLDDFASEIDAAIGTKRVDYDVTINSGYATVTEGNDGWMVNRDSLASQILSAFKPDGGANPSIVAHTEYAALRVDEAAAQQAANNINKVLSNGCNLSYKNAQWQPSSSQLGSWVRTEIAQSGSGWTLNAYIDGESANSTIVRQLQDASGTSPSQVTFEVNGSDVLVKTNGETEIPDATSIASDLSAALFGDGDAVSGLSFATQTPNVNVGSTQTPAELSFDDALDRGVIGVVGTYTTEYTTGSGTENRNHNIELVSQLLSNSVVSPGDTWSYNDTTGDCDESKGFLGAGAIVAGEYTDSVGGGICQVATTVFNAVYESGLPVVERHNHSLYISSYPAGRDAAVSYGELDLRWKNDTESDILVRVSTTSGSVTATLYGIDPGYQVTTETGSWEAGEEYSTVTKVDESLAPGAKYVKTQGTNGSSIDVTRTVKDSDGNVVRQDLFASVYDPNNKVIVTGPSSSAG